MDSGKIKEFPYVSGYQKTNPKTDRPLIYSARRKLSRIRKFLALLQAA
jgi:hypothetical protein